MERAESEEALEKTAISEEQSLVEKVRGRVAAARQVESSAAVVTHGNQALDKSFRHLKSELQQEKTTGRINEQSFLETLNLWNEKSSQLSVELTSAGACRSDEESAEMGRMRKELDTSCEVRAELKSASQAMDGILYAE